MVPRFHHRAVSRTTRWIGATALLALFALTVRAPAARASGPSDPPDVSGTWGQRVVMTSVSNPPVVGTVTSRTITHLIYEIAQEGRDLDVHVETCDVAIRSDSSMMETILPDRFADALPDRERSARLVATEGDPVLQFERSYTVLGARLREPTSEHLPSSPDDPRVVDVDGDDHPGITVQVQGIIDGSIYVAQRAWDRYRARVSSTRRIVGRVDWNVDQSVLDATSIFLQSQPPTHPHPDASESSFEMVRVPSDLDCSALMERRDELFDGPI